MLARLPARVGHYLYQRIRIIRSRAGQNSTIPCVTKRMATKSSVIPTNYRIPKGSNFLERYPERVIFNGRNKKHVGSGSGKNEESESQLRREAGAELKEVENRIKGMLQKYQDGCMPETN